MLILRKGLKMLPQDSPFFIEALGLSEGLKDWGLFLA